MNWGWIDSILRSCRLRGVARSVGGSFEARDIVGEALYVFEVCRSADVEVLVARLPVGSCSAARTTCWKNLVDVRVAFFELAAAAASSRFWAAELRRWRKVAVHAVGGVPSS